MRVINAVWASRRKKEKAEANGSVQFSSVTQSCLTLCDPMNRSTPGLPVHHQLPEFTQTRVHQVSDAIRPSHPLSSPSPPAPNPSQHQSLFQRVNSSHEVAKVLEFSFSIIPSKEHPGLISFRMDWLDLLAVQGTLKSKQRHYFANKGLSSQGYGFSSGHVWMWELDCEESWAPKNWCFWTVVLEKLTVDDANSDIDCAHCPAFMSMNLANPTATVIILSTLQMGNLSTKRLRRLTQGHKREIKVSFVWLHVLNLWSLPPSLQSFPTFTQKASFDSASPMPSTFWKILSIEHTIFVN